MYENISLPQCMPSNVVLQNKVQVNLHPSFYFCYRVQFPSPHIVGVNSGSTVKMFDC